MDNQLEDESDGVKTVFLAAVMFPAVVVLCSGHVYELKNLILIDCRKLHFQAFPYFKKC